MDNKHEGHRSRMKARYDKTHFDSFADHEILEMLLYYSIRRGNTNGTAHELLERFNSINNVINAPYEKLIQVKGVGPESARMLTMLGDLYKTIEKGKEPMKLTRNNAKDYLLKLFKDKTREEFYIICLDPKGKILCCKKLSEGSFESVEMDISTAVRIAIDYNSSHVLLAHNHPSGIAIASDADIVVTRSVENALFPFGIKLIDHIIVADDKCVSILENHKIRRSGGLKGYY